MADSKSAADKAREAAAKNPDATQEQIAKKAGVSKSTVGRALSDDKEGASPSDVRPLNDDGVSGDASPGDPDGGGTDTAPASALVASLAEPIGNATNPVSRRDVDAGAGGFVDVVSGEHQGRFGHFFQVAEKDAKGVAKHILIRTRDARNEILQVKYSDVRPSERNGGR